MLEVFGEYFDKIHGFLSDSENDWVFPVTVIALIIFSYILSLIYKPIRKYIRPLTMDEWKEMSDRTTHAAGPYSPYYDSDEK